MIKAPDLPLLQSRRFSLCSFPLFRAGSKLDGRGKGGQKEDGAGQMARISSGGPHGAAFVRLHLAHH